MVWWGCFYPGEGVTVQDYVRRDIFGARNQPRASVPPRSLFRSPPHTHTLPTFQLPVPTHLLPLFNPLHPRIPQSPPAPRRRCRRPPGSWRGEPPRSLMMSMVAMTSRTVDHAADAAVQDDVVEVVPPWHPPRARILLAGVGQREEVLLAEGGIVVEAQAWRRPQSDPAPSPPAG